MKSEANNQSGQVRVAGPGWGGVRCRDVVKATWKHGNKERKHVLGSQRNEK